MFALARTFAFTRALVVTQAVDLTFVLAPALNFTSARAATTVAEDGTTPPTELAIKPSKIILLTKLPEQVIILAQRHAGDQQVSPEYLLGGVGDEAAP